MFRCWLDLADCSCSQIFSNTNTTIESTLAALDKVDAAAISKVSAFWWGTLFTGH